MNNGTKKYILISVILPLAIGGFFYYLFCPEVLFVKKLDAVLKNGFHICGRVHFDGVGRLIRNYLPDLLWAYALAAVIYLFIDNNARAAMWSVLGALLIGAFMEILQKAGVAPGTFDYWDMVVECIGAVLGATIIKILWRKGKK